MKAEELMVGDWVLYGEKPVQILQLSEGKDYKEIRPIPLTTEILEKNGFKNQGYFGECISGDWRILCDTKNVAIFHREHCNVDTPIEYVHDLQHALRLCKNDKTIEL